MTVISLLKVLGKDILDTICHSDDRREEEYR